MKEKFNEFQYLMRLKTEDGFTVSAYLIPADCGDDKNLMDVPVLLQIHGLLGHFLARGTPRQLPNALFQEGYSSLSINTRLAYAGQINGAGIFDDCIKDIDAAIAFLNERGFRNIYILGYSLGAAMLVNWAAQRKEENVRGLILEGAHYAMPHSWKNDFHKWGSTPTYEDIYEKAKQILGDDPYNSPNDETFVVYQSRGPNHEPISSEIFTYKTWWFMAGPEAYNAMAYRHIGKIKLPILILGGVDDFLIETWEPGALEKIAKEAGNRDIEVKIIPGARHDCMENPEEMIKHIVGMFEKYSKTDQKLYKKAE